MHIYIYICARYKYIILCIYIYIYIWAIYIYIYVGYICASWDSEHDNSRSFLKVHLQIECIHDSSSCRSEIVSPRNSLPSYICASWDSEHDNSRSFLKVHLQIECIHDSSSCSSEIFPAQGTACWKQRRNQGCLVWISTMLQVHHVGLLHVVVSIQWVPHVAQPWVWIPALCAMLRVHHGTCSSCVGVRFVALDCTLPIIDSEWHLLHIHKHLPLLSYPSHYLCKVSKISPSWTFQYPRLQSTSRLLRNTPTGSTAGSSSDKKSLSSKRYRVKIELVTYHSLDSGLWGNEAIIIIIRYYDILYM